MIELTDDARKHLDDYLRKTRSYLQGCKSVDASDIEQNIKEHIESELADKPAPVSCAELDEVLERLGSPRQWVAEEELSPWRKFILRLRTGPEDWRLAYISFALFILSFLFASWPDNFFWLFLFSPVVILGDGLQGFLLLGSFIAARAAVSTAAGGKELGAQRWLLYPALIVIYLPIVVVSLGWPAGILGTNGTDISIRHQGPELIDHLRFALTGVWLAVLGVITCFWPKLVIAIFRPFANRFNRKTAISLIILGLFVILMAAAGFLLEHLRHHPFTPLGLR
jgi:hypothetical protein